VALDLNRQSRNFFLDVQRRQTRAKCVVLQGNWRSEDGHNPVAGELVHRTAIAMHHPARAVDKLGHDLP
jgi:hypothetical protein